MNDEADMPVQPPVENTTQPPAADAAEIAKTNRPKIVANLLANPPLLERDDEREFESLFDSICNDFHPATDRDFRDCYEITIMYWDLTRYQQLRVDVVANARPAAAESMFKKSHESAALKAAEAIVALEATEKAKQYFADRAFENEANEDFNDAGYATAYPIEVEALQLSLPTLATLDRMITSTQKRSATLTKTLEKRIADRAAKADGVASEEIEKAKKK